METNLMPKDSIEKTPSQSTTNVLTETPPLATEDASSGETPLTEVVTEQKTDNISAESQPTNDNTLEPTIAAEPIGTGATIDVVTAKPTDPTPVEVDNEQYSAEHTGAKPAEEVQQEEIIASITSETAEGSEEQSLTEQVEDVQHADRQRSRDRRELMKSASLVSMGNLGSSVLGMVRQTFIASTGAAVSGPFLAAISPAQKFNDFVINGSVPGALIPTFNDYAAPEKREELRRLVFTLVNLVVLIMAGASIMFFFVAPWLVEHVLATKFDSEEQVLTLHFAQIIFLSLLALGPFAVLQAALFARKEFGWPAFATAAYHAGIITGATLTAVIGSRFAGAKYGIAFGVILGAIGEIGLLLPGLYRQRLSYMFVLDLKQPAIRRILLLYGPIAFSFFVSACAAFLDQSLATQTPCMDVMAKLHITKCGDANFSAMQFATTLIQFPGGLVASALSFAVLPALTTHIREGDIERFKSTLLLGFRLGLLLMIPAAAGLIVLQLPIISLLFKHGSFTPEQSVVTATALQNYAYQLPFIAIDQLLISAFYARKNTIIPVAVGIVSVFGYLIVALPFWQTLGMPALVFANTVQNSLHAIILLVIMRRVVGPMHLSRLVPTIGKLLLAAAIMVAVAWGLQVLLAPISLFSLTSFIGRLLTVLIVGVIAGFVYFAIVTLLKVEEVTMLKGVIMAKLGRR
jgi:putative peptidoglycan lipid II flippase